MTNAELADQVGLSPSGVQKRLKKLEEGGLVKKYATVLDRAGLGYDMLCFVQVSLRVHVPDAVSEFDQAVLGMPEILECHRLTGNFDYLLKVVVHNREHLDHFLMKVLMPLPAVDRVYTSVVLREIKETTTISTDNTQSRLP